MVAWLACVGTSVAWPPRQVQVPNQGSHSRHAFVEVRLDSTYRVLSILGFALLKLVLAIEYSTVSAT